MKKKIIVTTIIVLITFFTIVIFAYNRSNKGIGLVSPEILKPLISKGKNSFISNVSPTPVVNYNPSKEIRFDGNTNLKEELESINPSVGENDFLELKALIESL